MSKINLLAAGAIGYVLGARAGRERYEQIVHQAQRLWGSPSVQQASHQAQDFAREKGPQLGERIGEAAKAAASKATDAVTSSDSGESSAGQG